MTALLGLIIILAIHAVRLDGGIDWCKILSSAELWKNTGSRDFSSYNNRYEPSIFTLSIGDGINDDFWQLHLINHELF